MVRPSGRIAPRRAPDGWTAALCIVVVTIAYATAACCRFGWTWDGSFLFFRIVEDHVLPIPHGRWTNAVPMQALVWTTSLTDDVDMLGIAYGLYYAAFGVAAFACGMLVLRDDMTRMRIWVVLGVLFVPLPGIMCPTMEVTPCLQLVWPLLAWIWAGHPRRWLLPMVVLSLALFGLHPVAAPLLVTIAAVAWWHRRRVPGSATVAWGYSLLAAARVAWTAWALDGYERAQFDGQRIVEELLAVLFLAPVAIVCVLVVWAALAVAHGRELDRDAAYPYVWAAVLLAGVWFFHDSRWWSGSFNYRKFGIVPAVVVIAMAALGARRLAAAPTRDALALVVPCLVFASLLTLAGWSWNRELTALRTSGDASGSRIIEPAAVTNLVQTPLYHWSGTVTSILVQGHRPRWVLRAYGVSVASEGIRLWSSEVALRFEADGDPAFDLSRLRP